VGEQRLGQARPLAVGAEAAGFAGALVEPEPELKPELIEKVRQRIEEKRK
jgi:hypothetical protein